MNTTILKKIFGYVFVFTFLGLIVATTAHVDAYNCKTGDTECEAAKANMQANQSEAKLYTDKAESVGQVISQLNAEINSLNAEIAANEAKITQLNAEIEANEAKLAETQAALAEMLINMHLMVTRSRLRF